MLLTSVRKAFAVCVLAAWGSVAFAGDAKVTMPKESVKGDTTEVMGLRVTGVKLRANVLGCMCWADDKGTAFWALDPVGTIRRISFPELEVTHMIELNKKCSWLSPSADGVVVSVTETKEVWVLDPTKSSATKKIAVPFLQRAASALSLSTAFAASGKDLNEIDLKKGKTVRYSGEAPKIPGYKDPPVVSPNGKYLFIAGGFEDMHRFGIKDGKAKLEQSSPRISQGRVDIGVQVSADSKFVTLPCYAGNYGGGRYGIFMYPVENIERAEATLEFGGPCGMAISADPRSGKFYSQGQGLLVFDSAGQRENDYKLGAGDIKQLLVHPQGGRLVLLGTSKFVVVEMSQK